MRDLVLSVEQARHLYIGLAILCSLGFGTTLALRWDDLARGERITRVGLVFEHIVLTYGGYVALSSHLPGGITAPLLAGSMAVILLGLLDFIFSDLLPAYRPNPRS